MPSEGALFLAHDRSVSGAALARWMAKHSLVKWVYLGDDTRRRLELERGISARGVNFHRDSIADRLDRTAWSARRPYIEWIGRLSRRNNSLAWWASELASKNPYHLLFPRWCLLRVGVDMLARRELHRTLVVSSSEAILQELSRRARREGIEVRKLRVPSAAIWKNVRSWLQRGKRGLFQSPLIELLRRRSVLHRYGQAPTRGRVFVGADTDLIFSWIDGRNARTSDPFRDLNMGPIPCYLQKRERKVGHAGMVIDRAYEVVIASGAVSKRPFFFLETYYGATDWIRCWWMSWCFRPKLGGDGALRRLAREHVRGTRPFLTEALRFGCIVRNMSRAGVRPGRILYPMEGHSWEHTLVRAARKHLRGTALIGVDAGVFSSLVLSMFPAKEELLVRPLPDHVITQGPAATELLRRDGVWGTRVLTGCGIRHAYLREFPGSEARRLGSDIARILIAPGVDFQDTLDLTRKAIEAFGADPSCHLTLKCHPLVPSESVRRSLGNIQGLSYSDNPVSDLLKEHDVLLYTYTSVCFEALRFGVFPVFVRSENFLNFDKLEEADEVRWVASSTQDLVSVLDRIRSLSASDVADWQVRAEETLDRYLAPIQDSSMQPFLQAGRRQDS